MRLIDADELSEAILSLRDIKLHEGNDFMAAALTKFAQIIDNFPEIPLDKSTKI